MILSDEKSTTRSEPSHDQVPQLDSVAIVPTNEADVDALGNIPELPATERNHVSSASQSPVVAESNHLPSTEGERARRGSNNHVMSWAQFSPTDTRSSTPRLSQQQSPPDVTPVWDNLNSKGSEQS